MPGIKKRADEGINTTKIDPGDMAPNVPSTPETPQDTGTNADYSIPESLGFTEGVTTLGPDAPTAEVLGVDTSVTSPGPYADDSPIVEAIEKMTEESETIGGLEVDDQTSPVNYITIYPMTGGQFGVTILTNEFGENGGPFRSLRAAIDYASHLTNLGKKLHG